MTVRSYLMGLPADPQAAPVQNTYRWATVTDPSPLEIQMDGDSLPLASIPDCLCDPLTLAAGDRVWTQIYGKRVVVHGAQGGGGGLNTFPNEVTAWLIPDVDSSSSSGAFVDWPMTGNGPLTATLTKRAAGTKVVVLVLTSALVTSAPGVVDWGISVDGGAGVFVNRSGWNVANAHASWPAIGTFTGLAVGARTFTLQMKSPAGSTVQYDGNDTYAMTVREVAG